MAGTACVWLLSLSAAHPQTRPYIGYAYPAGGQQGTTFQVKLGGQGLDDAGSVVISGTGVSGRILEYHRSLGPQETTLLNEQLRDLKRGNSVLPPGSMAGAAMMAADSPMTAGSVPEKPAGSGTNSPTSLAAKIEKRLAGVVNRPASAALAHILYAEITVSPDAVPGPRELRIGTPRGISNPLVIHVGEYPEFCRKPMITAAFQVLGKEELALRKRPSSEAEARVTIPCTLNGQVASGEVNRYRFHALAGQQLVISVLARQLIPFIADAVPGWFQPVIVVSDQTGKELAYADDFRFRPDPAILFKVPGDDDYILTIYDAIYRGREDFVYRVSIGESPFVTGVFPLGAGQGSSSEVRLTGWNLDGFHLTTPGLHALPGVYTIRATNQHKVSNPIQFAIGDLPEVTEHEPNNLPSKAQKIRAPVTVNGRISTPGDWDYFLVAGKSNDTVVIDVTARKSDSPLDAIVKVTDEAGTVLAVNDDRDDPTSGAITHIADPYLVVRVPSNGKYYICIGDTARAGGEDYAYRMRVSPPQQDFALRIVPSSISMRTKSTAPVSVHLIRKDGCTAPVRLGLMDPPPGFAATPVSLVGTQTVGRLIIKTDLKTTDQPVPLKIIGTASVEGRDLVREAVPAEDRMQAFLWRHLVPAEEFLAFVYDPNAPAPPKRSLPQPRTSPREESTLSVASTNAPPKPKFSKQQVAGRLRQLKALYEEGLLTDDFYCEKVAECQSVQ